MKGKLTTNLSLTANTSIPKVVHEGGASTWNEITGKPFSRVDTENGLAIYDNTLMIDTLDKIATIDYVDQEIASVESEIPSLDGYATEQYVDDAVASIDLSDYATKSELDAVEAEIPSLTGYATESYVDTAISNIPDPDWSDIQNKPTFATVATSGDYDDLLDKPTIPQADGTTIIDNNGVFSAVGSGVEIDNKSIIKNADDELQTAVPLYSEVITEVHNTIRQWDNQYNNYGSTDSAYITYCKNNTTSNASTYYTVVVNYTYNGNDYTVSSKVNNIKGNVDNVDQSSDMWAAGFHTLRLVNYIISGVTHDCWMWCSNQYYTVNWVMIKEIPYDETYSSSDITYSYTQYHQVPGEYLPIKISPKQTSGQEVGTIEIDGNATTLYAPSSSPSEGIGISVSGNKVSLNTQLSTFGPIDTPTVQESTIQSMNGAEVAIYTGGGFIKQGWASNQQDMKISTYPSWTFDSANSTSGKRDAWYTTNFLNDTFSMNRQAVFKYYEWQDATSSWVGPCIISVFLHSIYDPNTNPKITLWLEGAESIVESLTYDSVNSRYNLKLKPNITLHPNQNTYHYAHLYNANNSERLVLQKMNYLFIPYDNETIVHDGHGNIKTAIPAPPTTDGTYTLQVTVSNGEPTYSWI